MQLTILAKGEPLTGTVCASRDGGGSIAELCATLLDLGMAYPSEAPAFRCADHCRVCERTRTSGIPSYKLSGDDWYVSSRECAEALVAYERAIAAGAPQPGGFAADFVGFLMAAARCDGFRLSGADACSRSR